MNGPPYIFYGGWFKPEALPIKIGVGGEGGLKFYGPTSILDRSKKREGFICLAGLSSSAVSPIYSF